MEYTQIDQRSASGAIALVSSRDPGRADFPCYREAVECVAATVEGAPFTVILDLAEFDAPHLAELSILANADLGPVLVVTDASDPEEVATLRQAGAAGLLPPTLLGADGALIEALGEQALRAWEASREPAPASSIDMPFRANLERLVRDALHEFRTPLTTLMVYASMLADRVSGDLTGSQGCYVDHLVRSGNRLVREFDDLRDTIRLVLGSLDAQPGPCPVEEILDAVTRTLPEGQLPPHIKRETPGIDQVEVWCDGEQIGKALSRILGFAEKVSSEGVLPTLTVRRQGEWVELAVEYEGLRPTESDLCIVREGIEWCEGYYKSVAKVFGLGMDLAMRFIERNGSRLVLAERPFSGGVLSFELPAGEPQAEGPGR